MPEVVGVYLRISKDELEDYRRRPDALASLDVEEALGDGRALDLGQRWAELGCLLDGGIAPPRVGPTVGEEPLGSSEEGEASFAFVAPERVGKIAEELSKISRTAFLDLYRVDDSETADCLPEEQSHAGDGALRLYKRFAQLRAHYADAASRGEAMLVRIGERTW